MTRGVLSFDPKNLIVGIFFCSILTMFFSLKKNASDQSPIMQLLTPCLFELCFSKDVFEAANEKLNL